MIKLKVKKFNKNTFEIESLDECIKDPSNFTLNSWLKFENLNKDMNKVKRNAFKNATKIGHLIKYLDLNSIGVIQSNANNCQFNNTLVCILSNNFNYNGGQFGIYPENIDRVILSYSARSLVPSTWLNNNDEYQVPSEKTQQTLEFKQFTNDCFVYSLFSLQSSMRDVENFDDTTFDIFNHFFWMSNSEMKELADEYSFMEMYQDAEQFSEDRYMYNKLQELELSDDAQDIIESLRDLTKKSMKYREMAHEEDEDFHLQTWDAGWYQIRMGILKKYMKDDLKEFMAKFKEFEKRLRPLVYEFGFLPHDNNI